MRPAPLPITRFVDYRKYVRAWLDAHHARSMRSLAKGVGVHHSFVSMVLKGKRSVAVSDARTWAEAMRLDGEAQTYFEAMVRWRHGATPALRRAARVHLDAARNFADAQEVASESAELLLSWHVIALYELARLPAFQGEVAWIAERLWPRVSHDEIQDALDALEELGALARDAGGALRPVHDWQATDTQIDDRKMAHLAVALHKSVLDNAVQALGIDGGERYLGAVTLTVRRSDLGDIVGALHQAQLAALEPFRAPDDADHVVTVSLQVVPHLLPAQPDADGEE